MLTFKKDNWEGCSAPLKDAITMIDILLKNNGIKAECTGIYLQYKKYDGFALYIDGEQLSDKMIENVHLQFSDDYSDYFEGYNFVFKKDKVTTEIFIKENSEFYILKDGDTNEDYIKDMPIPKEEEYESIFDGVFNQEENYDLDSI